jgi:hypothetical protein
MARELGPENEIWTPPEGGAKVSLSTEKAVPSLAGLVAMPTLPLTGAPTVAYWLTAVLVFVLAVLGHPAVTLWLYARVFISLGASRQEARHDATQLCSEGKWTPHASAIPPDASETPPLRAVTPEKL